MKHHATVDGLPSLFVERLRRQFPHEVEEMLSTFHQRPPVLRINTLMIEPKKIKAELLREGIETKQIHELPDALWVPNADRKRLTDLPAYLQGQIYLQSVASQLVVKALDPQPGEKILDLCAAPGSKTTQIGILMKKRGELIANEPNKGRFFKLRANLKHQHLEDFVQTKSYPGQNYPRYYPEYFDKVLVDAPCSSEARFDRDGAKTIAYWSNHKIKAFARLQKKLLSAAILCCRQGGTIVYSTCTFAPEENQLLIDAVIKKHPEISMPIDAVQLKPDVLREGFFIAVLLKKNHAS